MPYPVDIPYKKVWCITTIYKRFLCLYCFMKNPVDEIVDLLQQDIPEHDSLFGSDLTLEKKNFHLLPTTSSDQPVIFIDGGNQEVLGSPHFSVQYIRVAAVSYQAGTRVGIDKHAFYVLIRSKPDKERMRYEALSFDTSLVDPELYFYEKDLPIQETRTMVGVIGNIIRRIAELRIAILHCSDDSIIVFDGDKNVKINPSPAPSAASKTESFLFLITSKYCSTLFSTPGLIPFSSSSNSGVFISDVTLILLKFCKHIFNSASFSLAICAVLSFTNSSNLLSLSAATGSNFCWHNTQYASPSMTGKSLAG